MFVYINRKLFFLLPAFICLFLVSCLSDLDLTNISKDVQLDQSLVLPVGSVRISVQDLLDKYGLPLNIDTADSELNYSNNFDHEISLDKVELNDSIIPFEEAFSLPPAILPAGLPLAIPPIDVNLDFMSNQNADNGRIDKILVNSMLLDAKIDVPDDLKNIPASDFKVELVFNDSDIHFDNGVNPVISPVAYKVTKQLPIGSYALFLNGRQAIPFKLKISINPQAQPIVITSGSYVSLKMNFSAIKTKAVFGFFKIHENVEDIFSIPIDLNGVFPGSHFIFANPSLDLTASTNIGMKFNINIDYLKAYNSANPSNVFQALFYNPATQASSPSKLLTLNGPETLNSWVTNTFDQFNSQTMQSHNFFEIFPYPDKVMYHCTVSADSTRLDNFITPGSKVKLHVKLNIPFSLREKSYYMVQDTIEDFKLPAIPDNVDSATLVLSVKNRFPVEAIYRMTFWKSDLPNDTIPAAVPVADDATIGTINSNFIVNAPEVDPDGKVVESGVKPQTIQIALGKSTLQQLKETKFIIFSLLLRGGKKAETDVPGPMHLTTKNNFEVKIGVFLRSKTVVNIGSKK